MAKIKAKNDFPPIVQAVCEHLVKALKPKKVILWGSYAKGTNTIHSDVDMIIVTENHIPLSRRKTIPSLFYKFPVKVDVLFLTEDDVRRKKQSPLSLINSALSYGITLYSSETLPK